MISSELFKRFPNKLTQAFNFICFYYNIYSVICYFNVKVHIVYHKYLSPQQHALLMVPAPLAGTAPASCTLLAKGIEPPTHAFPDITKLSPWTLMPCGKELQEGKAGV